MEISRKSIIHQKLFGNLMVFTAGIILFCCSPSWSQTNTHRILISGCNLGYTAIVGTNGTIEWQFPEGEENDDSWLLPDGNIVWSYMHGVKIVKPDYFSPSLSQVIWNRPTPAGGETHSCQPLDGSSDKFLIGESYDTISYIIEVDTSGKVWKKIGLPRFGSSAHNQFRHIRKTPQETYLVTQQTTDGKAFEYDSTGKLLRTFPDGRYEANRLANGNTLIACGDNHRIIEVDTSNAIVWEVNQNDIQGNGFNVSLGFVAGLLRLPNGNTIICNWGGHGGATGPAVLEITPEKTLVWSIAATIPNSVASIQLLDDANTDTEKQMPGPTNSISLKNSYSSFSVYDLQGRLIHRYNADIMNSVAAIKQFLGSREIGLQSGPYIIAITRSGERETHKVIIIH